MKRELYFNHDKDANHREIKPNTLYVGVEIESVKGFNGTDDELREIEGIINIDDGKLELNTWSLIYDGSPNVGAEYVSQILTPNEVEEEIEALYNTGVIVADEGNGQHIHFTREEVGNIGTLQYLSCYLIDEFHSICGRYDHDLREWATMPLHYDNITDRYEWIDNQMWEDNRYCFLNTLPFYTVEFRFFNTTDNPTEAVKRIELLLEVVKANLLLENYEVEDLNESIIIDALAETEFYSIYNEIKSIRGLY